MKETLNQDDLTDQIAVIVGTRSGIIKLSPVIQELHRIGRPFFLIHTGQSDSYNNHRQFFADLNLPEPRYQNHQACKEEFYGARLASMLVGVEKALLEAKPGMVLVGGDADSNLAGAVAVRKLGIPLAHMEAGLRSRDWSRAEEHNRIMIDHISEILFSPTEKAKTNLLEDNIKGEIYVVGNTIVDAVLRNRRIADQKSSVLGKLKLEPKHYMLLTAHQEEHAANDLYMHNIIQCLPAITKKYNDLQLVFLIHPLAEKKYRGSDQFQQLEQLENLHIISPLDYLDFLNLLSNCRIVLTDSGGIQEEACVMQIPCVTLRENTERPETVDVGGNILAGTKNQAVLAATAQMLERPTDWSNPFGDGKASTRIVAKMCAYVDSYKKQ